MTIVSVLYNYLADHFPRCWHETLLGRLVRLIKTEAELVGVLGRLETEGMQWGAVVKSLATWNRNSNKPLLGWAGLWSHCQSRIEQVSTIGSFKLNSKVAQEIKNQIGGCRVRQQTWEYKYYCSTLPYTTLHPLCRNLLIIAAVSGPIRLIYPS